MELQYDELKLMIPAEWQGFNGLYKHMKTPMNQYANTVISV